ncbi:hypothetical protein [Jannaschia donghaensis]|uniref:Uncharacterized protein n=1 Tax=Jannaschia donghaensis TaxID=420998 RepID=A0A0M6YM60_9RHOB|nr:hypothetical protein [Jannaschia donghaensis]CTQ50725.1 hypothetical protein JDO7802_02752 [Jannaschia donghaensis]
MNSATEFINLIQRDVYTLARQKTDWRDIAELQADLLEFFLDDQFLKKLVKGVMRIARDKKNPIRGNLVASGLREVTGHILHSLAPDDAVRDCVWFVQAKDTKTVTRRQKAHYIVHAGLPEDFVKDALKLEMTDFTIPLLDAFEALNKSTHVRAETIVRKGSVVRQMILEVFESLLDLLRAAIAGREEIVRTTASVMHNAVFENLISETIQELDEIATHATVDGHHIDTVEVRSISALALEYVVTGEVEVELQYGSNSDVRNDIGFRMDDSYPYSAVITSNPAMPMEIQQKDIQLQVDNSSFYE